MAAVAAGLGAVVVLTAVSGFAAEEVCVSCERAVVVTGEFAHGRGRESLVIEGAPRRQEEAFREDIAGTNFTVSVPGLAAGAYTLRVGVAEVEFLEPGHRAFDVVCGEQVLASNLDVLVEAGGAGKVYFVTGAVEHPGGDLRVQFTGRGAKLNLFELRDGRQSLLLLRADDLISRDDEAVRVPVVEGPEFWKDFSQPVEARVADLVRRLSLVEKAQQMRNDAPAIPRLGIPAYNYWSECLHGVGRAGIATVFPQAIGLAATWDAPLVREVADSIATEARAKHHDYARAHGGDSARYYGLTFWTPNINIFRDPRWGRGQETYGEDPFLTGQLGVAFIRGLQGDDPKYIKAMACAKHFAVHSGPEPERHHFDVAPSEQDLYDTYLPHFEMAAREGRVGAFMGAYNRVYGEPACSSSFLLEELLRRQWGFTGHVVSDCGAIYDIFANHKVVGTSAEASARAVRAGCDLCCGSDYNRLVRAVKEGLISTQEIDRAVSRLFDARFRLGMFDPPERVPYAQIPISANDSPEHAALALRAARESIVLLKNNGVLPLNRAKLKRIAVIGTNAVSVAMLLGNYNGTPSAPVTILDGIRSVAGPTVEVMFAPFPLVQRDDAQWSNAVAVARSADAVIYVGGISPQLEGEEMRVDADGFRGGDRTRIELPAVQAELVRALGATGKPLVVVNCSGSAVAMPDKLPAIVQAWYPGQSGGRAVAEVIFGDVNPAGRLPVTFYRATADLPAFEDYSMANRTYRFFTGKPQFAFGHGLSYTRFAYRRARLDKTAVGTNDTLRLTFTLANTGGRDGDEVVQVYVRHGTPALCGFQRVHVPTRKTIEVTMEIPVQRFRRWDTTQKRYVVAPGHYELLLAAASDDIRARLPLKVVAR